MEKIQIFISSTFKDMDAERDMVNHFVKQRIEKELARYSIFKSIEIVDLRWGVNTQDLPEDERENKVLRQCVDNIRSSRPYFIAFIGDRYGWIPPKNRWQKVMDELSDDELEMLGDEINEVKSVTELEILFGALKLGSRCLTASFCSEIQMLMPLWILRIAVNSVILTLFCVVN